ASVVLLTLVIRGLWTGKNAKWAFVAMGVLLLCDVGRADRWWLKYYNYKEKYAMNPVLDFLRKDAYEKRSTAKLMPFGHYDISACPSPRGPYDNNFYAVCNEWLQNQFPYYDIQALDIVQAPRTAEMDNNMALNFTPRSANELPIAARLWQLSNTRYIFCWAGFLTHPLYQGGTTLQGLDPSGNAFQVRTRLKVVPGPGVTMPTTSADLSMEPAEDGEFALVEYTNTLPRAKLYSNWQSGDSTDSILATLKSASFDPQKTVIVAKETPVPAKPSDPTDAGTVKIEDYHPKYIKMQATAKVGSVMLLNDHYNAYWQVWVDNKQQPLLQCNYLMKGVYLDKGQHTVEWKFRPPQGGLYVTVAAWGIGILVAGFVFATNRRKAEPLNASADVSAKTKPATERL
ncbi:MAG: YfhO family protein, partial [Limisphaerales bacterium]